MLSFVSHATVIIETSTHRCEFPGRRWVSLLEEQGASLHNPLPPLNFRGGNAETNLEETKPVLQLLPERIQLRLHTLGFVSPVVNFNRGYHPGDPLPKYLLVHFLYHR